MPDDEKTQKELELEQQVTKLNQEVQQSRQQSSQLLSDPDVLRLVQLKQQGKKVSLAPEDEVKEVVEEPEEEEIDWDELDNAGLAKEVMKRTTSSVEKVLNKHLKPVNEKFQTVESFTKQEQAKALQQQVAEARKKYTDFDDYQQQMVQLNAENPSLNVSELYILAKAREGKPVALREEQQKKEQDSVTERPVTSGGRPSKKPERKEPLPSGARGFRQLLSENLESKDFSHYRD